MGVSGEKAMKVGRALLLPVLHAAYLDAPYQVKLALKDVFVAFQRHGSRFSMLLYPCVRALLASATRR